MPPETVSAGSDTALCPPPSNTSAPPFITIDEDDDIDEAAPTTSVPFSIVVEPV